jgi:hypothetical protein
MATIVGSKLQTGLPQFPSGVPDALYNQFFSIYQAISNLARQVSEFTGIDAEDQEVWNQLTVDQTVWQINPGRLYVIQNEAMAFGECASLILVGAEVQVRKANATDNTRPAYGFISSINHASSVGSFCEVTLGIGMITGVGGLAAPQRYFLSTTSGVITNGAPVAAGNIEQVVGFALAGNRLLMNITMNWIQH